MKHKRKMRKEIYGIVALMLFLLPCIMPLERVAAAGTASAVSVGTIDYENLTIQVYNNNNSTVFYSTDNSTWTELEGNYDSIAQCYLMDISWIPVTSDTTLYLKGNVVKTVKSVTLPEQNSDFKVAYDKVEGEFSFDGTGDSDTFEWRKSSDYYWTTVELDETSDSYEAFAKNMKQFLVKGSTILFRLPQVKGKSFSDVGTRPSLEQKVIIPARAAAPAVKVNTSKLTISTTSAMEYYDTSSGLWIECDGAMSLESIAPSVLFENGAKKVTLAIRKTATETAPCSKTAYLTILAQSAAPSIGDSTKDITYYFMNSKLMLQFNNASKSNVYEYTVISDKEFSPSTAIWKSVNSTKLLTLSATSAPSGCTIYVRRKGVDAGLKSNSGLVLSSAVSSFTVKY